MTLATLSRVYLFHRMWWYSSDLSKKGNSIVMTKEFSPCVLMWSFYLDWLAGFDKIRISTVDQLLIMFCHARLKRYRPWYLQGTKNHPHTNRGQRPPVAMYWLKPWLINPKRTASEGDIWLAGDYRCNGDRTHQLPKSCPFSAVIASYRGSQVGLFLSFHHVVTFS